MATRAGVEFVYGDTIESRIYVQHDGYPDENSGGLADKLVQFLKDVERLEDNRFDDPIYLSAKFLVWYVLDDSGEEDLKSLDFLGIGPCIELSSDIEYLYRVDCSKTKPEISVTKIRNFNINVDSSDFKTLVEYYNQNQ